MGKVRSWTASFRRALSTIHGTDMRLDEIKMNQGQLLAALSDGKASKRLADYEFRIFSQWGEDGIIQHLTKVIDIKNKAFIEFGVQDFSESNCRYLLMKDDWDGFVIDGSSENMTRLRESYYYYKHNLVAIDAFITKDNINELLARSGFSEDIGILSVDLDGNDYYILQAIKNFQPSILICEYNAVFGPTRKISVPYDPEFIRSRKHHSHLYYGASLGAMAHLANLKGYSLVGINSNANNAFFVRNDLLNDKVEVVTPEEAFSPSKFRESRDESGNLTYSSGEDRLKRIEGMPVWNVITGVTETL